MIQRKLLLFSLVFLLFPMSFTASGQPEQRPFVETTYEVTLHVLSTSRSKKSEAPPVLSAAIKKLMTGIDIPELNLEATYLERTSNSINYKGPRSFASPEQQLGVENFCEWGFRFARRQDGDPTIIVEGFRFGTRLPVAVERPNNPKPSISYEWIGITDARFKLNEGEPTLVASLIGSGPGEMIFVFLTVRSA
ncbi:MAG TPA: hypothetical protein PKM58_01730 [Pyrinomonadaceae bacterium]|nr:hypothetical protein [Pyrinomonadaceae bacterium]HNU06398.1 hypothetical protein [Pyrinomonadaceae bacterium]